MPNWLEPYRPPLPPALIPARLRVVACPHPFREAQEEYWLSPLKSLLAILREVQPDIDHYAARVWVGDEEIPRPHWAFIYPAPGSHIFIKVLPQGPIGRTIGMIFVAIAAIVAAVITQQYWGIPLFGMKVAGTAALMGGLAGLPVGILGSLALNALIPPTVNPARHAALMGTGIAYGSSVSDSPTYSLSGGSNQANRWGPIPKIFGIHKHFPPYGAETYTEIVGDEQFLRLYFVWGISRAGAIPGIQIENLKIGETALGQFEGVEIEHRNLILKLTEQTIAIDMTAKTLSRAEGSWIAEGIKAGNTVTLSGCTTPGNDGDYLISAVTALVLTYSAGPATTTEAGNGTQTLQTTFGDEPVTLYTNSIHEDPEVKNILLEQGERVVRTSQAGPRELSVDISFPSLYANNPTTGARGPKTVTILIEYRETGAPDWQTATTLVITAASNSAVRRGHRWSVNEAADPDITYDIGITRVSPGPDDSFSASVSYWTALRSIWITEPFSCAVPVAKTIMRIKASNELSGTVDKFSALCSGIEPDWDKDTQTWVLRVTQNPASHFREMLQGPQNMDPYADSEIHLLKLQYWHEYCATQGWEYNKIIDYDVEFEEILAEIAATGRASLDWLDSKRSVIIDEPQTYQIGPAFTPRNSKNFSSQIVYPEEVHCWRCAFLNELNDFENDERLVLLDGYARLDANGDPVDAWGNIIEQNSGNLKIGKTYMILACTPDYFYEGCAVGEVFTATAATALNINNTVSLPLATIYTSLPLLGVTHPNLIFRHARFHGAQLQLRFERHDWEAHLDQLVARRGNRAKIANPVILVGLSWGRVKSLVLEEIEGEPTGNLAGVILDAKCPMQEGGDYAVRFRRWDNVSVYCEVMTEPGEPKELTFAEPITPYDPGPPPVNYWPTVGDLFMFGESGQEAGDVILYAVRPNANLGAKIAAVPYDEAIYQADLGVVPPHDPQISIPPAWWSPEIAWMRSGGAVLYRDADGTLSSRILLSLIIPGALNVNITGVEAQYWVTASNAAPVTLPVAPLHDWEVSIMPVEDGVSYDFRLRYVKKDGSRGPWTETQTHTVEGKTAPPADVTGLAVNQLRDLITASWAKVADLDLAGYECRYGSVGFPWAAANLVNGEYKGTTFTTTNIPPGTWDVMLKAMDTSGNYSETEARVTITVFTFYEILSEQQYAPLWEGTLTNYRRNPRTGYLNPVDQAAADAEGQELFEKYVIDPYDEAIYEGDEIDLGEDKIVRAWGHIDSNLGPGESGLANPEMWLRYKPDGGAYTDWLKWTIGLVEARYFKFRLRNLAAVGNVRVTGFKAVLDQPL